MEDVPQCFGPLSTNLPSVESYEGVRYVSKKPSWCWVSTWACLSPSLGILFLVILVTTE